MSIKSLLMPAISQRLLGRDRLLRQRAKAERLRRSRGQPHQVHVFHQVDDPYSAVLAGCLPELIERYDIELIPHLVGPPPDSAAPARDRLVEYSRRDAQLLAQQFGLPFRDPGRQPADQALEVASGLLVTALQAKRFVDAAPVVSQWLWQRRPAGLPRLPAGLADTPASAADVARHCDAGNALRQRLGHYLGATLFYAGEWYWGIDRLHHLESRLQDLGAQRAPIAEPMFKPPADLRSPIALDDPPTIDFFFSLRSPYSAIVAPRVFALGRHTGAEVRLRPLLPMVMRGLPVPPEKRRYISLDVAREAHVQGTPFGRVNDPVGRPTERGLAVIPLAEQLGLGQAYVLSFMQGVWAEGIDAGSDRGLRRITERVGLAWADTQAALADEAWRTAVEFNRFEMFSLGLWGVPSFRVGETAVWGQDRLWAVQQAVLQSDALADADPPDPTRPGAFNR